MKLLERKPARFKIISVCVCFIVSLSFINRSQAQLYPVQITPQLVPPYSVYLSDYAAPGSEKLRVIVLQRDLTQPSYQLRLVMSVELNGKVIMRTAKAFNPAPLNIDPGVPTIISGAELAPYVDSRNIDFIGYSREQYERTRALPEGSYRIIFTAYDYRRQDVQVSNEGSSFYYLSKNEPPLINFPACGTRIARRDPQQIVFSWLPRNTSSPTSAGETEYEFTLYETRPAGRNPNDIINTTQPIFRTRIDVTTFAYGPTEPPLLDNMKYVWRVQAIDKSGRNAFRNNGYSEVCTFTYGGADATFDIGVVQNLQAIGETERRAKIWWEASSYDGYKVYYKKTGKYTGALAYLGEYEWFWKNVTSNELILFGLEPDTEYETRVQTKKSGVFGPYSEIVKFRTQQKQVIECGKETVPAKADESKPLQVAQQGMTILVDDMEMTLVQVRPLGGGWFQGLGTVAPKILGRARFNVKFDRLYIDENQVAGFGRIDFVTEGVADLAKQQIANAILKDKQAQQQANREQWAGVLFQKEIFKYDEIIISDIHFEDGTIVITDSAGNTYPNEEISQLLIEAPEKAIIIEDKSGDQWVVQRDSNGENKITKVPGGGLVVGPDGMIISGRILNNLYKKVLVALRKYKRAVDEYQASINQTQPGRGGGPSLFEDEIEMLMPVLPPCLDEYRDQMRTISANITTYLDSGEYASIEFGVDVATVLSDEFTTEESQDNAPQEKVDVAVCVALVGKLFKTFFNSKYVVVKNTLKQTAWGTTKGKDQFAQDIVAGVDSKLELLDKDTLKTLILITSLWVHKGNNVEASLETEREKILKESKAYLAKDLVFSDFNLLVIVISKYDTALNDGERKSKFNEAFYPMDGLDSSCVKSVRDYINSDSKKQWINGLDEALMERTEKLLEKLKGCKVEKPEIDDSGNKRAEIANRMDGSDTRRYGRFLEPARLTDVYVDCAEFVYDVLTEEGFKIASGDCEIQSDWYKAREETKLCVTGSNPSDVVVGDILLWKGNWKGAKEYAHTGIVVQVAENVVHVVNAGNQGCHCDNGWDDYKVKNKEGIEVQVFKTMEECYKEKCKNPAIWKSTGYFNASTLNSKDHTFKYWARPNLTK